MSVAVTGLVLSIAATIIGAVSVAALSWLASQPAGAGAGSTATAGSTAASGADGADAARREPFGGSLTACRHTPGSEEASVSWRFNNSLPQSMRSVVQVELFDAAGESVGSVEIDTGEVSTGVRTGTATTRVAADSGKLTCSIEDVLTIPAG